MTDPTAFPTHVPAAGGGPAPEVPPLRDDVYTVLLEEGYRPEIDEDGDVSVRVQGQGLFVRCLDTRPLLMRVFGQWLIGDDVPGDELTRLRATNSVVGALNLIKATIVEDRLLVAVDLVVGEDTDLPSLLAATFEAVLGSVHMWFATVQELARAPR